VSQEERQEGKTRWWALTRVDVCVSELWVLIGWVLTALVAVAINQGWERPRVREWQGGRGKRAGWLVGGTRQSVSDVAWESPSF
jgi:hypothetical protein